MLSRPFETAIGTTGIRSTLIGFGGAEIGNLYEDIPEERAQAALQQAYDAGIRLFDTSPFYGYGLSEVRFGQFLRTKPRDSYTLVTKVGRYLVPPTHSIDGPAPWAAPLPFRPVFDYGYDGTMRALEQSTMRLGIPKIDVALIHDLDRRNHGDGLDARISETMKGAYWALQAARSTGDVSAIGIAVNDADVAARLIAEADFDCVLLGSRYTLLEQSSLETFFDTPRAKAMPVLLAGIFNSGILATSDPARWTYDYGAPPSAIVERRNQIAAVAQSFGIPLAAAALQFALALPTACSAVIGMSKPERIAANMALLAAPIPAGFWQEIRDRDLIDPNSPLPNYAAE